MCGDRRELAGRTDAQRVVQAIHLQRPFGGHACAARQEAASIRQEDGGPAVPHRKRRDGMEEWPLPEMQSAPALRGDELSVWRKGELVDSIEVFERGQFAAWQDFLDDKPSVVPCRVTQAPRVRRETDAVAAAAHPDERARGIWRPQPRGAVPATGDDQGAGGIELHVDGFGLVLLVASQLLAGDGIPQPHPQVEARRGEAASIGMPRQRADRAGMAQAQQAFASFRAEDDAVVGLSGREFQSAGVEQNAGSRKITAQHPRLCAVRRIEKMNRAVTTLYCEFAAVREAGSRERARWQTNPGRLNVRWQISPRGHGSVGARGGEKVQLPRDETEVEIRCADRLVVVGKPELENAGTGAGQQIQQKVIIDRTHVDRAAGVVGRVAREVAVETDLDAAGQGDFAPGPDIRQREARDGFVAEGEAVGQGRILSQHPQRLQTLTGPAGLTVRADLVEQDIAQGGFGLRTVSFRLREVASCFARLMRRPEPRDDRDDRDDDRHDRRAQGERETGFQQAQSADGFAGFQQQEVANQLGG